ncbi:hypothetical protein [Anabaena sp. CS-542/02]|nr:hypothetical protein [Anabaena sp. CS-542/02]MDB9445572.1 hypothetical protein [Anabaena sp. CS-542/02]
MAHLPNLGIDPKDWDQKPDWSATLGDRLTVCIDGCIIRAID